MLAVTYSGTLLMYRPVYSLYGDGRFVVEQQSHSGELLDSVEMHLSFAEVQSLLRTLIDHGFLDTTQRSLEDRLRGDHAPSRLIDGGTMMVAMHLDSYTKGKETVGPLTQWIAVAAPGRSHRPNPAVPELTGFSLLAERLVELERTAKARASSEIDL